ncbi:Fur family transcriptional regulator [Crassaminicella indica]|uniref:Transcriptional repressor n=1 Tax=Crassaminicella indica TaxID=2855394 RepID=A0ABX8RDJ5_9CLOT|nr:transcriptional repressor [Crassaminicella indica]QXM06841.1 transcriptional repressor [Crassaminicella indica]
MIDMKIEDKLSKNQLIVYQIFKENSYQKLNIKEIMKLINEKDKKISKRTVYRILKALMNIGKIYCSDMYKGMRSFELIEQNHCLLVCKKCAAIKVINIDDICKWKQLNRRDEKVKITGGWIKLYGLCKKCMEKTTKVIDNYNQLAYNIVDIDNCNQLLHINK